MDDNEQQNEAPTSNVEAPTAEELLDRLDVPDRLKNGPWRRIFLAFCELIVSDRGRT